MVRNLPAKPEIKNAPIPASVRLAQAHEELLAGGAVGPFALAPSCHKPRLVLLNA
jgi:hypothetical protein